MRRTGRTWEGRAKRCAIGAGLLGGMLLFACSKDSRHDAHGRDPSTAHFSAALVGNDFSGNSVLITGARDPVADAKLPCASSVAIPAGEKLVFVTNTAARTNGNLGGLDGADAICAAHATAAALPGVYKAWLSTSANPVVSRFTHSTVPYALVDGTLIANDWADLTDGTLAHVSTAMSWGRPCPLRRSGRRRTRTALTSRAAATITRADPARTKADKA